MPDLRSLRDRLRRRLGRDTPAAADPTPSATTTAAPEVTADPSEDERARARLAELTEARRHEEALALAQQELARIDQQCEPDRKLLRQIQMTVSSAGALSVHLQVLRRRTELSPEDRSLRRYLRAAEGRWRESEPGWLPTIDAAVLADLPRPAVSRRHAPRVLHLLKIGMPQRQSGYSMRSMYTLTGQVRAGLDPIAVTALDFPRSIGVDDAPDEEIVGGVRYRHLLRQSIPKKEPWDEYLSAYATSLAPVVAEEGPDLIHVHSGHRGTEAALVALAVGRALDVPVVYEVRGFFEALWTKDVAWAEEAEIYHRRRAAEAHCLRESAAVVTLSESMKEDIVDRDVDPDHVHVVPNGVDPAAFVPVPRDEALSAELGLTDRFVFGYVSNLDHYREGQELLIDAAVELRRRGVAATALIVGDGSRRELLEQHARDVGAEDIVHFTGRIPHEEVAQYYAQIDVFVIPRINERAARLVTPLKPYEAMALGIPLVVSDLPALREITGDGARGETFITGDGSSLAEVLERLAASPEGREQLVEAARSWVLDHRTWAHNDDLYARIYDSVLTPSSSR